MIAEASVESAQPGSGIPGDLREDPARAWAPYEPGADRPWDIRLASHLLRRAAFGGSWDQIEKAVSEGPARTVERLLRPDADVRAFEASQAELEAAAARSDSTEGLRTWWLRRMMLTPHPLLESVTLFWHGHFAISADRVKSAPIVHDHVRTLRRNALGDFRELLRELSPSPALLAGLEARSSRRAQPNDLFARRLFEVFTLGPGNFSEADIREAARAFTGWFVLRDEIRYIPREHDGGPKKILGREGNFAGEDVVKIVLEQPATSRFVVRKLWRWLISESEEPSDALVEPLARSFAEDFDIRRLVETLLRSSLFFSAAAYRQKIRSPVELSLAIVRPFGGNVPTIPLGAALAALGQDLCRPPTIRGWAGGTSWINRFTVIGRENLTQALLSGSEPYGGKLDPAAAAASHGRTQPEDAARFLLDLLLGGDCPEEVRRLVVEAAGQPAGTDPSARLRGVARTIVMLPEFQLS